LVVFTGFLRKYVVKEDFANRLANIMVENGYVSNRSNATPNASTLASNVGVSRTMANKYLRGNSIPDTRVLHKISEWLKCDPWWLLYGKKKDAPKLEKICAESSKLILLALKDEMKENIDDEKAFSFVIDDFIEVYNSISQIKGDLSAKIKSIEIMLKHLRKNKELSNSKSHT